MKKEFNVTGMSCAACSATVEKAVRSLAGVESAIVNLLTSSMTVDSNLSDDVIIKAVEKAGYGAALKGKEVKKEVSTDEDLMKMRLYPSLVLLFFHLYISMGAMINLPLGFFTNHSINAVVQLTISIVIIFINRKFFISGTKSLLRKAPNMDSLVALGASASFIYSYVNMLLMFLYPEHAHSYYHNLYFEAVSTILTLITLGKCLEARSKTKTTDAINSLIKLSPEKAIVLRGNEELSIDIKDVKVDDIFIVYPGSSVPVDGVVISGDGSFDESSLTGESMPVNKSIGSNIFAGCICLNSNIKARATRVGEDTTLSKIIKLVEEASSSKAPISRAADKVSGIFVPCVILIALMTFIIQLIITSSLSFALSHAVAVLVISCPCALGLATPVAIMVSTGKGAKNGILFKDAAVLENTCKAGTIVFDKTGTITTGKMKVCDVISFDDELLKYASSIEAKSEHPLAKAISNYGKEQNVKPIEVENFKVLAGNGVEAIIDNSHIIGGSVRFVSSRINLENDIIEKCTFLSNEGKTPLIFTKDSSVLGIIAISDSLKEGSKKAIDELKNMGLKTVLLTGDNNRTANAINKLVGFDEVISDVLPDGKEAYIRKLQKSGKVIMVGDGINDSPALMRADIGIAISGGTDAAIGSASIIIMGETIENVVKAIRLSRRTLINIKENLFWAFIYNAIGIPLAAGVFGLSLNPMFASFAMSLSSFCVVSNALRINMMDISSSKKDRKYLFNKERKEMTKTIYIEEMMCQHCEKRVKKALEALDGVVEANVSFKEKCAIVTLSKNVSDDELKNAVEAADYPVTKIE